MKMLINMLSIMCGERVANLKRNAAMYGFVRYLAHLDVPDGRKYPRTVEFNVRVCDFQRQDVVLFAVEEGPIYDSVHLLAGKQRLVFLYREN